MLLTIVMPVYNAEAYLESRLKRLIKLNLDDVQIIAIDDGSTDRSHMLCRSYLAQLDNAVIIRQENRGLSAARNRGIENADGEYILFLDSDDILLEVGFSTLKVYLLENKPDVLMGKYVIIQEKGRDIWPDYTFPEGFSAAQARSYIYSHLTDSVWNAWRYICRRDFLFENRLFFEPGIICEDMEWTPRILKKASSIEFLDKPFYGHYYNRPGSITRTAVAQRVMDVNKIVANSVPLYRSEDYGGAITYRLIRESFFCLSRYCQCGHQDRKKLRPALENAISVYQASSSPVIWLFLKTRRVMPLYVWSVFLLGARVVRGGMKGVLGPHTLKRLNRGQRITEVKKVYATRDKIS